MQQPRREDPPDTGAEPVTDGSRTDVQAGQHPVKTAPATGRGNVIRCGAVLFVALLTLVVLLGYRGELPGWSGGARSVAVADEDAPPPPLNTSGIAGSVEPKLANVNVTLRLNGTEAAGSGIVLSSDGLVLTSEHVVKDADTVTVTDLGTSARYEASVVGYDADADIALLSLTGANALPVATIGSSARVHLGDGVMAIGNAGGTGIPTALPGKVTALDSSIVARNAADMSRKMLNGLIEVAAPVMPGQSGGALADRDGAVIGVVTAASGEIARAAGHGSGYAVPIDTAMNVVRQIRSGTATDTVHIGPTATLGVVASDATPAGARIDESVEGQPASGAGMAAGEVITGIDGHPITSVRSLKAILNIHKPDDTIAIDLAAPDGTHRAVSVTLGSGPPN